MRYRPNDLPAVVLPEADRPLSIQRQRAEATGAADPRALVSERWERIALLPGLDLMMKADASPLVRKLAQQFYEHCVASAQPVAPPVG